MKISSVQFWAGFAVFEAIVIISLIASRVSYVAKVIHTPVMYVTNPLKEALEYDASDKRFEELVKRGPDWMAHRPDNGGKLSWPILADCALLERTNYVRILVAHGADVDAAMKCLKEAGSDDAIALLQQIRTEHSSKVAP